MKSIIQSEWDRCFFDCGRVPTDTHHVFHGRNRHLADEDGLTIRVCQHCHREIHEGRDCKQIQAMLHEYGQRVYMQTHSLEDWMKRYGRNYLEIIT